MNPPTQMPSRLLGVDLGQRRVGVAVSDPTGTVATPLATIEYRGPHHLAIELRRFVRETGAQGLVIGVPVRSDGVEGPEAAEARTAAERIGKALGLPVALWDERMTTRIAERTLIESGVRRRQRRQVVDCLAAQILLQSFLDARALAKERAG